MKKRDVASRFLGGPIRPEELEGDYIIRSGVPQPGPELDVLFLDKIEGFPAKKTFITEYGADYPYYIPSGKPTRTHMIDAKPVPRFSRDDATALAALERFAAKRGIWWRLDRAPGRYSAQLLGADMPIYAQTAKTLAHAIVLAMLTAAEVQDA